MAAGPPWGFSVCLVLILIVLVTAKSHRRHHVPDDHFPHRADDQNYLMNYPQDNSFSTGGLGSIESQGPRGGQPDFLNPINLLGLRKDISTVRGQPLPESYTENFEHWHRSKLSKKTVQRRVHQIDVRHLLERRFGPPPVPAETLHRNENTTPRAQTAGDSGQANFPTAPRATIDAQCCALLSGILCIPVKMEMCQRCKNCTIEDFVTQTCPSLHNTTAGNTSHLQAVIGYADETSGDTCGKYYQNSDRQTRALRRHLGSDHECRAKFTEMCPSFDTSVRQVEDELRRGIMNQSVRRAFIKYKWRQLMRKRRPNKQQVIASCCEAGNGRDVVTGRRLSGTSWRDVMRPHHDVTFNVASRQDVVMH